MVRLLAKKKSHAGQTILEIPTGGTRKKLFDYFNKKQYDKAYKNIPKFKLSELENVLIKTSEAYEKMNHAFQIDINNQEEVDLQIVHPVMISSSFGIERKEEFGFVVYYTFDGTNNTSSEVHTRFLNSKKLKDYVYDKFENTTDCYAFMCGNDKLKVNEIVNAFMSEIFKYPDETEYYFSINEVGPINNIS